MSQARNHPSNTKQAIAIKLATITTEQFMSAKLVVLLFSGMCWQGVYQIDLTLAELYLVLL
jgi:hypothetical protein